MKIFCTCLALLSSLFLSIDAISSSSWDEEIVGDFNAGQLFTLAEGDNWFIGNQAWSDDPIDGFRFIVPNGYRASIEITYSYLNLGVSEGTAWVWELYSLAVAASCTPDVSWAYSCLAPEGSSLITSEILQTPEDYMTPSGWDYLPIDGYILNAGVYQLADNFGFTDNQNSVLSYSFNLSVAPIPPPDGDLNADNQVNAGDVLIASRIALGLMTASIEQMDHGDVAPLLNGSPTPDGTIDVADVLVIQRKAIGEITF